MTTAPLVPQTAFVVLARTLGPGVARYQAAIQRKVEWERRLNGLLDGYGRRLEEAATGAEAAAVKEERDLALDRLAASTPPPPDPNLEPGVTDEDKRLYHQLVTMLIDRGSADLENMVKAVNAFNAFEADASARYIDTMENEVKRKEAADRREWKRQHRKNRISNYAAFGGRAVSTVLSAIPTGVTQVIGGILSVVVEVGKAAYDIDVKKKYAAALRDNANWLLYEQPEMAIAMDRAIWNEDYGTVLLELADVSRESLALRKAITSEKLKTGIWDEKALAASRRRVPMLVKGAALIGGGLLAMRLFR